MDNCTPMHYMMSYQSSDLVQQFLAIVNQDTESRKQLIKIMGMKHKGNWTPMHYMMTYQSSNVVQLFAEILNHNSLANEKYIHLFKIENNAGNTALHLATHYQTTQGMAAFFACLNTTIDLSNFIIEEATQRQLARQLIEPTLWQRSDIEVNVKQLSNQLLNYHYFRQEVQDAYLAGIPVAETLVEQLKNNATVEAPMFQQAVASDRSGDNHQATSSYHSSAMIYLPTVAELNTVSQLYEHLGTVLNYLHSLDNVQTRRALYEHAHPDLRPALEDIWRKRSFLPSIDAIQKPQQALTNSEQQALEQFHQGQALVKIIKPDNFQDFLQQLKKPQYRPKHLRTRHSDPQYKYVHLEHRIVPFDPNHKNRIKQNYRYTKKTAMTLISQQLNTPVFGAHDPHRELVGLQFDSEQAQYKAYLQEDHHTVNHGWYSGDYDGAQNYSRTIYLKNFTDFNSFWQQVQKNGSRFVNETLAKVNLLGLQSVVIARDTNKARQIARERSQQLSEAAQKPIPIVFYDCMRQQISPYTTLQQQADEQQLSEQQQANEQSTSPQA